jgi:hypothetical protein
MINILIQISFWTSFLSSNTNEYNFKLDEDGTLYVNEQTCKRGTSIDDFNGLIKSQPTRNKFHRMRGEEFGWRCLFYEDIGVLACSMPLKRRQIGYGISNVEIFFSYDKLYKKGRLFETSIIINGVNIDGKVNFNDVYNNPKLKKCINMGIYEDKNSPVKSVIELRLGTSETQVFFNFKDNEGSQLSSIHLSLR